MLQYYKMSRYDINRNGISGFTGISQQSMNQQQMGGRYNTAFNRNEQLVGKPNFTNDGKVLHNNMGEHLHDLKIVE
jgi:hypothetical protein